MAELVTDASTSSPTHGSTLFVSNLPYTATSVDLQTLFSDIGPVRSAFVVTDKETKVSKGVGYVSFAIREDAQRALDDPAALQLDGRTLRLQWPSQKNKDVDASPEKPARTPKASSSAKVHDPLAARTIVISGLPADINSKVLWKKIRKEDGAEDVQYPVDGVASDVAHAVFTTPTQATAAVQHLHAHVFKGALLSVTLKQHSEALAKRKAGMPSRSNRLIVRNLPFDTTEADIRATFLPFGPIYSIDIPTSEDNKIKGFAFVWFVAKNDAAKALLRANGKPLKKAGEVRKFRLKGAEKAARIVAVDWALSKTHWEAEKAKLEDAMEVDDADGASASGSSSEEESDKDEDEDGDDALGVHDDDSDDEDRESGDDSEREDDDDAPKIRPELPQTDVGTTLFIRNVPYDATEDDLRTLFRAFGPLRYARITMDRESGRSRGTGFACFWNREDADAVIEHAQLLRDEIGDTSTGSALNRKNPFSMPSILTPDPSSSLARTLVLHGRTLDVTRAVTRDQAGKLKEEGERRREKADKRNLYLMREGVIFPNSPAAASLTPVEIEKRQASYNARRTLLRSNPSLYVSKTRLSVRQLPMWASERVLKRLAVHAVRAFEADVRSGARQPLADDELHPPEDEQEEPAEPKEKEKEKDKKRWKPSERPTVVSQSKIVRQQDRLDPLTGKGRSRGYGFLQMTSHADALRVLRWANNNPATEALMRGWHKAELEDALKNGAKGPKVKTEDGKEESGDVRKARETRLKAKIAELEAKEGKGGAEERAKGGGLIMEFSIENVQVVKKRRDRQEVRVHFFSLSEAPETKGKKRSFMDDATTDDAPSSKRRRASTGGKEKQDKPAKHKPPVKDDDDDDGDEDATTSPKKSPSAKTTKNNLGSIIGRKRKERKAKRS
ncbi:hypothetical protein EXIGLDRAFT_675838 [Exidia glandulosa HHB12029]|uniref:RRM domain-containing protein n=1 Tax=Exidia glandulosa HHB12029 TaxID=1314781 RepID=A0A165H9W0_EXIGL|nr:hypothetical protein EXIGLDRAFT_675838 [Exidia glandulosa HHB12029]